VRRILVTGMSGTGKSSVVTELVARGHRAVDTDDGWCVARPDGRQEWDEAAVERLLDAELDEPLVLAGCEENQVRFHPRFDAIVLLRAPVDVLTTRLAQRSTNPFGKHPAELARILDDVEHVEPLLRRVATHEVDTTAPLGEVVDEVLRIAAG
jgi:broad-specificity NMP kinase